MKVKIIMEIEDITEYADENHVTPDTIFLADLKHNIVAQLLDVKYNITAITATKVEVEE